MSNIFFFSIPAAGHTNPTLPVVSELSKRGHRIYYYSFAPYKEKIEAAGGIFRSLDAYLPPLNKKSQKKMEQSDVVEMTIHDLLITENALPFLEKEAQELQPACIVADSVCFWGKLLAKKMGLPMICSTTTMAFNEHSSTYKKESMREAAKLLLGMAKIQKAFKKLQEQDLPNVGLMDLIQNDNETKTIVYTTKEFQPCSETFSENICFCGPSLFPSESCAQKKEKPLIYISLGTILNNNPAFFECCIRALANQPYHVLISCGPHFKIEPKENIASNIEIHPTVNQLEVLSKSDVFISHCGMNSVSESLYYGVPLLMVPFTSEQRAVAKRVQELGCGILLKKQDPQCMRKQVEELLSSNSYKENALKMQENFRQAQGSRLAADFVERML
jgi:MGT family glycosyltransferase